MTLRSELLPLLLTRAFFASMGSEQQQTVDGNVFKKPENYWTNAPADRRVYLTCEWHIVCLFYSAIVLIDRHIRSHHTWVVITKGIGPMKDSDFVNCVVRSMIFDKEIIISYPEFRDMAFTATGLEPRKGGAKIFHNNDNKTWLLGW